MGFTVPEDDDIVTVGSPGSETVGGRNGPSGSSAIGSPGPPNGPPIIALGLGGGPGD